MTPLPFLSAPSSLVYQPSVQEIPSIQSPWPSGRTCEGFLSNRSKLTAQNGEVQFKYDWAASLKKKSLVFSSSFSSRSKDCPLSIERPTPSTSSIHSGSRKALRSAVPPYSGQIITYSREYVLSLLYICIFSTCIYHMSSY